MFRNRLILIILFILSLVGISFVGGPVTYGFFFFVLITPLVSLIYVLIVYFRFRIYQKLETKSVVVNSPAVFYFTLQNEDFFAHAGIRVEFFSDYSSISGLDSSVEYELLPHTGVNKESVLVCRYRGRYEAGIRYVYITDYLRLFTVRVMNRETLKVDVMPSLEILDGIRYLDDIVLSSNATSAAATEPDVLVRDYVPGDDIRSINWKATARTGRPLVRKRIGENSPSVSIIMDSCRYSDKPREFLPVENKILETVLAVSRYYVMKGIDTGIYAYDHRPVSFNPSSPNSFDEFYRAISGFVFDKADRVDLMLGELRREPRIAGSGAVVMVLHEWNDAAAVFAGELDRYSVPMLVCLVTDEPADSLLTSAGGRIGFITIGSDDRLQEVL